MRKTVEILDKVKAYYGRKVRAHGATPAGVDWNSEVGQQLRFDQLLRLIPCGAFSLNDFGCGYGALFAYLSAREVAVDYLGCDLSEEMVATAKALFGNHRNAQFLTGNCFDRVADYAMASGVFNVRQDIPDPEWESYIFEILGYLNETGRSGFAFNCLTSYSDPDRRRADLFYADPCKMFDHCKRNFSKNVALLHDYGLFEFTILVRR